MEILLVAGAVFGVIAGVVADGKGIGFGAGFLAGAFFAPIGLVIVALMAPRARAVTPAAPPARVFRPAEVEAADAAAERLYKGIVVVTILLFIGFLVYWAHEYPALMAQLLHHGAR
jgi:hypothetical protein